MLTVNMFILLVSLWIIMLINHRYLQPALKNRHRFKLYRLRDELSLLAMRGRVDENSDEYKLLLDLLNAAISATGTFKVTDYLHFLIKLQKDAHFRQKLENVRRKVANAKNAEYCRIASQTFRLFGEILRADTRTLRGVFFPTLMGVAFLLKLIKFTALLQAVSKKKRLIERTNSDLGEFSANFDRACCV